MISVLCTNYNKGPYILRALESVIAQNHSDFELLVYDDASTDGSSDTARQFAEAHPDRVKFFQGTTNMGMAAAYNALIPEACGEWIALIDSDDEWFPDKLSTCLRLLEDQSECVMLQHDLEVYEQFEPTSKPFRGHFLQGDVLRYMRETGNIPLFSPTTGLMFRRSLVERVMPIPLDFRTNGEAFLTRTVCCFGEVLSTSRMLGVYRSTGTNVWFNNQTFDPAGCVENTLKPNLNEFYRSRGIDLEFKIRARLESPGRRLAIDKLLDLSPRRIASKLKKLICGS